MNIRLFSALVILGILHPVEGGEGAKPKQRSPEARTIDLGTALRLAGADNLDVKLARERTALAEAEHRIVQQQYFPWLSVGTSWRGHQENIQAVTGEILDVEKTAMDLGATVRAQLELGETYYRSLASRQLVKAADQASRAQRQDAVHAAALAYFDLVRQTAYVEITAESVRITEDYGSQVRRAVEAGIGFAGDAYRIETQLETNRLANRQAQELQRTAAARLAQILHLDPAVNLHPAENSPVPLSLVPSGTKLNEVVQQALVHRPELRMNAAQREAARHARDGAKYAPLVPSITGQYSYGGLAGGRGTEVSNFDESADYGVGLAWRIGPGGLFDRGRTEASESRLRSVEIEADKLREEIVRQAVESHARMRSLNDQISMAQRALTAAQKTLALSRERKEFGVGVVAETIQSEQDLTRARRDYAGVIAEFNKAQFSIRRAIGKSDFSVGSSGK
jgi:outer membrane protein TolC